MFTVRRKPNVSNNLKKIFQKQYFDVNKMHWKAVYITLS